MTNNKTIQLSTTLDLMKSLQHISNGNTGPADIISQHNLRSDNLLRAISPNYQVISDPTTGVDTPPSNPKSSTMNKVSPDRPVPAAEDPASARNHNPAAIVHQKAAIGKSTGSATSGTKKSDCVTNGADYKWRDQGRKIFSERQHCQRLLNRLPFCSRRS